MNLTEFLTHLRHEAGWLDVERVDVMTRGVCGDFPLHAAIWSGDDEAARALVDAGADINARGEEGYTPLHVAVAKRNVTMVTFLASRGASWDTASELGTSPRANALASDDTEILALARGLRD